MPDCNDKRKTAGFYEWQGDDLVLNIRVQPRAASDGFAEALGNEIKLRIAAPPVDGKANTHLIAFLAKTFRVARTNISIIAGKNARSKRVRIHEPARLPDMIARRR